MKGTGGWRDLHAATPVESDKILLNAVGEDHAAVIHPSRDGERTVGEPAGAHLRRLRLVTILAVNGIEALAEPSIAAA
jgi:hypothetical protein